MFPCVFVFVCLQDAFETSLLSLAGEIDKPELYRWMMRDQSSPDPQQGSIANGGGGSSGGSGRGGGGGDGRGRGRGRGRDRSRSRSRSRSREDRERDHRHGTFSAPAATAGGLSFGSAPAATAGGLSIGSAPAATAGGLSFGSAPAAWSCIACETHNNEDAATCACCGTVKGAGISYNQLMGQGGAGGLSSTVPRSMAEKQSGERRAEQLFVAQRAEQLQWQQAARTPSP